MQLRNKVLEYWNQKQLSSLESSTSHADEHMALFDNRIENIRLKQLFKRFNCGGGAILDIGAGYGRFVPSMKEYFRHIVLLEAAPTIFHKMCCLWQEDQEVDCHKAAFEEFSAEITFKVVFSSGVVYFYDDHELRDFINLAGGMLEAGGFIVFRDFISAPRKKIIKSGYVDHAFCHYRTVEEWKRLGEELGYDLLKVERSKPSLRLPRTRLFLKALDLLHLKKFIFSEKVATLFREDYWFQLSKNGIQTSFIVLQKQ
jgi:hypothetical protein